MAFDETLLLFREKDLIPNTLRLYIFSPSAVTFGYFQRIRDVVNLEYVRRNNIGFTRRITGGGAVYHDEYGEITYSIVASLKHFPRDILERYRTICMGVMKAIEFFGLKPVFKPVNDILVNNKKISGSAQTRKKKAFLQHGTLMYNTDLEKLAMSIKPLKEKLVDHGVESVSEHVTTLSIELEKSIDREEVIDALVNGFSEALGVEFYRDKPLKEELEYAEKLVEKYISVEWIFKK